MRLRFVFVGDNLEDRNIIIDLGTMFLSNTFRYPDDITAFLLFQLQVRIEYAEMELLDKCKHIQFHFMLEEFVLQGLVAGIVTGSIE